MSDNELDAELLALAGDDSPSDNENANQESKVTRSPSPASSHRSESPKQTQQVRPPRGVAQRKPKASKASTAKSRPRQEIMEQDEPSSRDGSPDSLGSGAMSESESDAGPAEKLGHDDGTIFPVDGKFRSEKDKAEIMAMSEINREEILAERAQEVERRTQDLQLRRLLEAREKNEAKAAEKRKRKSATDLDDSSRPTSKKSKASETLEAYKRKREQRGEQRKRDDDKKRGGKRSPASLLDVSDADAEGESDVEWDDRPTKPVHRDEPPAELRDFQRACVGRTNFAKVCFWPGFNDAIRGCFCRVSIGVNQATGLNTYRLTQIKGFREGRPYAMEGSNGRTFMTDQYAILSHGKAEKDWPFIACSDQKITDSEFERYKNIMASDKMRLSAKSFIEGKLDAINNLLNHRWTEEEIQEKLKRSGVMQSKYASIERNRIMNERKKAVDNEDEATIARLDHEMATLDGPKLAFGTSLSKITSNIPAAPKQPSQQDRLAALNRANRKANAEEVRKAQIAERRQEQRNQAAIARGEAVANPFARVKTRAKMHYDANESLNVPDTKNLNDLFGDGSDRSRAGTPATGANTPRKALTPRSGTPLPSQNGEKKFGLFKKKAMDDEIIGALDLGIEIDIV